ncbi:MAG: hypothetical protein ACOC5F_00360 [Candidatus Aminicenantaceae bacterium]
MKRLLIITSIFCLTVLNGQAYKNKFGIFVHAGLTSPEEKNINTSFESGFGLFYPLNHKFSLYLDCSHWKSSVERKENGLYKGKLSVSPFILSIHYRFMKNKTISPYVFSGLGVIFNNFKIEDLITIPEVSITQKVRTGVALQAGIGSSIKISNRIQLSGEIFYSFRKAKGETIIMDMNLGPSKEEFLLNMSSFNLKIGIKYQ